MQIPSYYHGKRVIVTGAASGMGQAVARMLVERSADVISLDINPASDGKSMRVDLTNRASIDDALSVIGAPVHALFSSAGLPHGPGIDPQKVFAVNFIGMRYLTEKMFETMEPGSAAVTVSSVAGLAWQQSHDLLRELMETDWDGAVEWARAHPDFISEKTCYTASKQAATYYTMYKCRAFTERGMRLNTVSPGPTVTGMTPIFNAANSEAYMANLRAALGRDGTAEDQANAMLFLNDGSVASYVNGTNLYVDNGMAARRLVGQFDISAARTA
jgi:NAD(P)-dependent dehydrogenase (short-subunit alcohol dehydrogenase family)